MKLLRAATLTVSDLKRSQALYEQWLDYRTVESGALEADLAASWGCADSAGRPYAVMQPESGAQVFLRFVEDVPHPDYAPLRTYGWAATEICVSDVMAVNARMEKSPFEIIGAPRELDGMPAIVPMQVKGPDGEIVYLTEIRADMVEYDLPRATSLIDQQFIQVLAASDLSASLAWAHDKLGLTFGREINLVYTMLSKAFAMPMDRKFTIATLTHDRDVFFEFDQLPPQAGPRPGWPGRLPPGVAISTIMLPDFAERTRRHAAWLIAPPRPRHGALYDGRKAATFKGPDGTLFEVMEA